MRSRSLRSSLLRSMIIGVLILDNTVQMTNGASDDHVTSRINLPSAVAAAKGFVCKTPQSRAYNLKDLVRNIRENHGEDANQPIYVILKRCDSHSGCCMIPETTCSPLKSYYEEIEIEIWSLETNSTRRQWIRVKQHGECTCKITTTSDRYQIDQQLPEVIFT